VPQALFSFFIIIPSRSCHHLDCIPCSRSPWSRDCEQSAWASRAISSFCSLSVELLGSAVQTASRQRLGCRSAVRPADQTRLGVSLQFPTFPCHPLPLLLHWKRSLGADCFLCGLDSALHSGVMVSKGSQVKREETAQYRQRTSRLL